MFADQIHVIKKKLKNLTKQVSIAADVAQKYVVESQDGSIKARRSGKTDHNFQYVPPAIYRLNDDLLKAGKGTNPCMPRRGAAKMNLPEDLMAPRGFCKDKSDSEFQ